MEKTISLTQIGLYNPRSQNSELTEKLFVIRQKQFEMLMEELDSEEENSIPQHHIIIAQRGMGKTTLLHRIAIELRKPEYNNRFIPLAFPEEQATVTHLGEFWLNCLDALADAIEYEDNNALEVERIDNQIKELEINKKLKETHVKAYQFFTEVCRKIKRRPVLLVDNIGLLFNRLDKNDHHTLRSLLSENGAPIVMAAGVVVLPSQTNNKADVIKPITDYGAPFYDYFKIHYLKKLCFDEFRDLIINLSEVTQSDISIINEKTPRLKTLHQLTGGNPRTAVMLFKLIVKGFSTEINDDLKALLDEITPLYKARYEELSEQTQTIIASIALNWEPISLRHLSQQSGYENNQLSPQLNRLIVEGWVETTSAEKAKGNAYSMSERFFNIWFLMRMSTRRHKQAVNLLTKFLESFYGKNYLKKVARNLLCREFQCENDYVYGLALIDAKHVDIKTKKELKNKILSSWSKDLIKNNDLIDKIANIDRENLEKTDKKLPDTTEDFKLGNEYYDKGDYDKAIDCYQKAIDIKPDDEAYYNMGIVYDAKGDYDKAIEYYQKAIELNPNDNETYYNMGNAYYNKGDYEKAIECYQKAIEINPDDEAYYNMGLAYYNKGDYEKAIECYQKAIEINPDDEAYYNMGIVYDAKGDYDKAIEYYQKAIDIQPNDEAYNNMGIAYKNKGNYDKAIECYQKAIELDKQYVLPKYNLQELFRDRLDKIPEAKELFNEIKDKLETDVRFLQETLFELHSRNEGIAKAFLLEAIESIKKELPKSTIDSWYYFAAICLNLKYSEWFLKILKEEGCDNILAPYYVAVQALEFEQKENQARAELYLRNRAIEIAEPARIIMEEIKKEY